LLALSIVFVVLSAGVVQGETFQEDWGSGAIDLLR
jgi:hypothetical protein